MLLQEILGTALETCPTASAVMAPASQCLDFAGLPAPTGIIHESNRLGLNFAGGHSVSVGERQRTGESSKAGSKVFARQVETGVQYRLGVSKVFARQVETGVQYRLGVPQTAGIVGFGGNVGVTETVTHMQSESKVSATSTTLTGATCRADVFGVDVGLHLDTGLRESRMLEHEQTGWLSSKTTETHSKGVQVLGLEVDHISGKVSEVNTYGPERFPVMEVERTGTLHPNGEVHVEATSYRLGEGGHMMAGAGAAGVVQGACDLLDGKSWKEAVHDGGSVLAQNVKDVILMKATGLPLIRSDSQHKHTEVAFANGASVGWGLESRVLHVPEGDLQQTTDGLQLGLGIPGDPTGVVQGRAALGRTVDHVAYDVKKADGTQRRHQATYTTSGVELDLSLGNGTLNPLRLGHVTEESLDESCTEQNGAKTEIQEAHKSDGIDLGIGFAKHLESETSAATTSAEGGVSTTHEAFQGSEYGFRTGLVNHSHAEGNFHEGTLCKDHSWTSKDGVRHHESLQESYSGMETRGHTTGFFGLVDLGTSVTRGGDFISEKHSGNSSTFFKDGQKIESKREEVTHSHGTKHTHNGSVVSEDLAVHKVVEEHQTSQTIEGERETTTRDVQSTFDGQHVRDGLSESSHGTWVSQEHLQSKTLDVTIKSQTVGEESGPVSADPEDSDVVGSHSHQFATDSFQIHHGQGDLCSENWFFAKEVHGKMHWDEKSQNVIVDEATTNHINLSAPVNCAIGVVTSSVLQLIASKGYLNAWDAATLCCIGTWQLLLFKGVDRFACQLGTKWLTLNLVFGIYFVGRELLQTYNTPSLSFWSKIGHSSLSLISGGGTLFVYWWFAQDPPLSMWVSLARFLQETIKHLSDGPSGNLYWHFVAENIVRNPNLGAAGAGFLGAKAGLALGMLMGPLGMGIGLGTAIGGAVGSALGMLGWTSVFDWLLGPSMARELQYAYTFLGVARDASGEEVNKAFRLKALKLHPGKPGGSEEQFKLLHAHYERILCGCMVRCSGNSKEHSKRSSGENKMLDHIDSNSQSTSIGHDFLNHEPVVIQPKGSINKNLIQAVEDNPAQSQQC